MFPKLTLVKPKHCDKSEVYSDKLVKLESMRLSVISTIEETEDVACIRTSGEFKETAIWLSHSFNWTIGYDLCGSLVAVPTKKETS